MEKELSQWICIARTGTFHDSNGNPHTFTASDLERLAASYDPKQSEAPLVLGHPKNDAPAFGWVHALKCEGSKLFAQFAHVASEVKEAVAKHKYKYLSMSIARDKTRLLHVGLLGAAAPAIDGLGAVGFAEEQDSITINFSVNGGNDMTEDLQKRNGALEEQLKTLQAKYDKLSGEKGEAAKGKEKAEGEAKATAAEFAAFKSEIVTEKREKRIQALVDSGKLKPAEFANSLAFATALEEVETPVTFCAADGKQEQISAEELFLRDLENREADPRLGMVADFSIPVAQLPVPAHFAADQGVSGAAIPSDITGKL